MDALHNLLARNSAPKLQDPAPAGKVLEQIFQAALRAPDHARLRPWRFLVIEGEGRAQLGELFADASRRADPTTSAEQLDKIRANPLRAPMLIVAATRLQSHPKVPEIEQYLSAGSAAQAMLLAAQAQGFAGIWRTGPMAFNDDVHAGLGLASNEKIVGFLYIGSRVGQGKPLPSLASEDFFQRWP